MNATTLVRLSLVHPVLSTRIKSLFALLPFDCEVSQGLRTWGEQNALYAQGRTAPGAIVTNAQGGFSAHNFGYAVDIFPEDVTPGQPNWNVASPGWKAILSKAPSCGLAEGACWKTEPDNPHLYLQELPATPTDTMRAQFYAGGLAEVWQNFPSFI